MIKYLNNRNLMSRETNHIHHSSGFRNQHEVWLPEKPRLLLYRGKEQIQGRLQNYIWSNTQACKIDKPNLELMEISFGRLIPPRHVHKKTVYAEHT